MGRAPDDHHYALLFWLAVQLMSGRGDANWLIWSLLFSGYVVAVVAVLQTAFGVLGGGFLVAGGYSRADSTLAHPDFLGIFLAMLLPIAFDKLISRQSGFMTRLMAANLMLVLSLGLLATFTRSAWIGAVVGLAVVLALRGGRFHVVPVAAFAAVLVIAFGTLACWSRRDLRACRAASPTSTRASSPAQI